jgi:hypothetical protein
VWVSSRFRNADSIARLTAAYFCLLMAALAQWMSGEDCFFRHGFLLHLRRPAISL